MALPPSLAGAGQVSLMLPGLGHVAPRYGGASGAVAAEAAGAAATVNAATSVEAMRSRADRRMSHPCPKMFGQTRNDGRCNPIARMDGLHPSIRTVLIKSTLAAPSTDSAGPSLPPLLRQSAVPHTDSAGFDDPGDDTQARFVETPDAEEVPGLCRQVRRLEVDHDAPRGPHRHLEHCLPDSNPLTDETLLGEGRQAADENVRPKPHRIDLCADFRTQRRNGLNPEKRHGPVIEVADIRFTGEGH